MPDAARMFDRTEHGGVVLSGSANVIINSLPAVRVKDPHICPLHGGGLVSEGSETVSINSRAAARRTDGLVCAGDEATQLKKLVENWKRLFDLQANGEDPAKLNEWQAETQVQFGRKGKDENNPYYGIPKEAMLAALRASANTGTPPEEILALWAKEGYLGDVKPTLANGVNVDASSPELARAWARSLLYYEQFGSDHFTAYIPHEGTDNTLDLDQSRHEPAFVEAIAGLSQYDDAEAQHMADSINSELIVTGGGGHYVVTPTPEFYARSLVLSDNFFNDTISNRFDQLGGRSPSTALNYLQWNMGTDKFREFLDRANAETGNQNSLEAIEAWALHTYPDLNKPDWSQVRINAIKFAQYMQAFHGLFEGVAAVEDKITTGSANVIIGP